MTAPDSESRPETHEEKMARRAAMPIRRFEGFDPGNLDEDHLEAMTPDERINAVFALSRLQRSTTLDGHVRGRLPRPDRRA